MGPQQVRTESKQGKRRQLSPACSRREAASRPPSQPAGPAASPAASAPPFCQVGRVHPLADGTAVTLVCRVKHVLELAQRRAAGARLARGLVGAVVHEVLVRGFVERHLPAGRHREGEQEAHRQRRGSGGGGGAG